MTHIGTPGQDVARDSDQQTVPDQGHDRGRRRTTVLVALGALAAVAALVGVGVMGHAARSDAAVAALAARQDAVPVVRVAAVDPVNTFWR
jgi:hypothetical protein